MGERSMIIAPEWAHWFLEVEDRKLPVHMGHDAEFHADIGAVKAALNGNQVKATRDVIAKLAQHAYPNVGDRCEIMMSSNVLIRLTRVR